MKVGSKKGGCGVSFSLPMHRGRCGYPLTMAGPWLTIGVRAEGLHLNKAAYLSSREAQGSHTTIPNINEKPIHFHFPTFVALA